LPRLLRVYRHPEAGTLPLPPPPPRIAAGSPDSRGLCESLRIYLGLLGGREGRRAASSPSLLLREPKPNLTHEQFRVLQNLFAKYPEKERGGLGEPQPLPRRGVQACKRHRRRVGAPGSPERAAAPAVTPAAGRGGPGLRPALPRSLRGPPAARPRSAQPRSAPLRSAPRLRPHSAASPQPRAARLRRLTGPPSPRCGRSRLPAAPALPPGVGRGPRGVRSNGPAEGGGARRAGRGGAGRTRKPGARRGRPARGTSLPRVAARRTLTPRRGPRGTDCGGPEPPAGGAALRGPRRVQTARVGGGSAVLGVAEPGRWEAFREEA
jgi:hypothetical protein